MAFVIVDLACQRSTLHSAIFVSAIVLISRSALLLLGTACSQAGGTAVAYLHTWPGEGK